MTRHYINRREFLKLAGAGSVSLGLAACAPSPTPSPPAAPTGKPVAEPTAPPAAKPTVAFNPAVRINVSPLLVNATFLVALRKKYLEDEGLKPEVDVSPAGPAVSIQLLSGGKIDMSITNPSSGTNNAILKGAPMVALCSTSLIPRDRPSSGLMISEKLWNEGVRSIKDLKGRTINIYPSFDSTSGRVMALLLAREGLDYRKDITVQDWTDNQKLSQAFLGGAIDNFYALEPAATIARLQANARFLGSSTDVIPGGTALLMFGNTDFVKANPETTIRVLKAYLRGTKYYNEALQSKWTKNADVLEIMAQETKATVDFLKQVGWNDFAADGAIDLKDLQETMQFFKDLGTTPEVVPLDKWIDQSYVKEAYQRLKAEGKV